ncbi:MAG: hypothetical protein WCI21_04960, partial [Alphaproteobacteria bacterium]
MAPILTPLALAAFLMVLIESFTAMLKRRAPGLPAWANLLITLLVSGAIILLAGWAIATNAARFIGQLEGYYPRIDAIMVQASNLIGVLKAPTVESLLHEIDPQAYMSTTTQGLQDAGAILILLASV